jgi:hypothetical protein
MIKEIYLHVDTNLTTAIQILSSFGLKSATSQAQYLKGTHMFSDPLEPGIRYAMYANGYYRKYISIPGYYDGVATTCYQLNKQTREKTPWGWSTTGRILIPGDYTTMALAIIGIAQKSRARYNKNK